MKTVIGIVLIVFGFLMFGIGITALVDVKSAMQLSNSQESIIIAFLSWILATQVLK